ncbi:hypothetical protein PFMG_04332 [Plasmodium falciparum IGH-CR14]|uniref:Uncharacterized protein n=1 Tax=Plasmodium falciparum IGH-CR14 TaxID=580059 RepID=A0A0L1IFG9_PLAFA|nr:hypothetical protein PFMG_04332 [Plasmodium falciparum IGH-CR14]
MKTNRRSYRNIVKNSLSVFLNDLIIEDLNYEGVQKDMKGRNVFYSAGLKVSVFEDKALDLQKCEWAKILRD